MRNRYRFIYRNTLIFFFFFYTVIAAGRKEKKRPLQYRINQINIKMRGATEYLCNRNGYFFDYIKHISRVSTTTINNKSFSRLCNKYRKNN